MTLVKGLSTRIPILAGMAVIMVKVETIKEGRFKRWSRLKSAGDGEEKANESKSSVTNVDTGETYNAPDPKAMPGGSAIRRGATVPAMPSLVAEKIEDKELEQASDEEKLELDVCDLTPEEREVVSQLPPIESLTKDSDYTQFLAEKVPEFIRRQALRVLWRSDPILANLDGLNDYDENFRVIDTLISAAQDTVYRVGQGHLKNEELEARARTEMQDHEEVPGSSAPESAANAEKVTTKGKVFDGEPVKEQPVDNDSDLPDGDFEQISN
ncbi:MAG: hypothetical protein CMF69_08550 [Magnetovibrio sp.]|nr:hypothetical protein [Magnetovibrio sp.]